MPGVVRLALVPIMFVIVAGCGSAGGTDVATGPDRGETVPLKVVVDVMSGVPNPGWSLTSSDSTTVSQLVDELAEGGRAPKQAVPDLGFRGFVLTGEPSALGSYDRLTVLGTEVIATKGTDRDVVLRDPDLALYAALRSMAQDHLAANVFTVIPIDGVRGA